jgi:hypothetical protein
VSPAPLAVLADGHSNRCNLEAVLDDLERRGVDRVVDAGDSFCGPLDPRGTAALLSGRAVPLRPRLV